MAIGQSTEILRLRAMVRDLLALSTMPDAWVGREPYAIARDLANLLIGSLELDFAFVRLCNPTGCQALEVIRGDCWKGFPGWLQQRLATFGKFSRTEIVANVRGDDQSCSGIVIPIGVNSERGIVAAASNRSSFPDQIDQQLLSAAANNAATAFQNAFLINELRCAQEALRNREQELRKARDELEIKVAERTVELQRSKAYLAEAQRISHTGSFGWNPDTGEIVWSDETYRIFEYESTLKPTIDLLVQRVHPEDRSDFLKVIESASTGATQFEHTYRWLLPDGSVKHVHALAHGLQDASGNREFVGAVTDITERKTAEEKIREQEAELRQMLDLAPQQVRVYGPGGERLYANRIALDYYGVSLEEWRQTPGNAFRSSLFVHPDDQERAARDFDANRSSGSAYESEVRVRGADGNYRWFLVRHNPLHDDNRQVKRWYVALTDIDERKRAEEKLQQLVDLVPQMSVVLGPDGKWIYANRVAREYTGLTLEEFRSKEVIGRSIHPDDVERARIVRERGLAGSDPFELDARQLGKDGIYRWFLWRYNPLVEEGRVRRWYVSATEIESRKQEEERVRQENVRLEERTRIAQELHDTLLQTFQSALLHLGVALDGVAQDSSAKAQLDRTLEIMRQGIEEGRNAIQGLRLSDTAPMDLVQAFSGIQREPAVPSDVEFRITVIGEERPLHLGIQHDIYRIGREALINAFRHSRATRVEVDLEYADSELRMRVRDNGRGVDPQMLPAGREGHWGLAGMRERAAKIGGLLKISSSAAAGTEVQLSVPGALAFQVSALTRSA